MYTGESVAGNTISREPMKRILAPLTVLLLLASAASAEVFVLANGGQLVGELLNPKQSPRKDYVVQSADGTKITLDAAQVKKVLRPRPDEAEYERIAPTYPDTVADQWKLAQWCREHKLLTQRRVHLRRVIELDPSHVEARRALGYSLIGGQWVTRDEVMTNQGYVRGSKGTWVLPQEAAIEENKKKLDAAQLEWCKNLKLWRRWLGDERDQKARDNILAISDPMAVKGLAIGLNDDGNADARVLFAKALGKIDNADAAKALAVGAICDEVEEVRQTCLDFLQTKRRPEVIGYFVSKLSPKKNTNPVINLAGIALGQMKDPTAVGPLIDALVTTHKFKIVKPGGDGATSTSFGGAKGQSGGSGMSMGGGPKYAYQVTPNQAVLDALVAITGQNFNFDKQAWSHWYRSTQKKSPASLDARRN